MGLFFIDACHSILEYFIPVPVELAYLTAFDMNRCHIQNMRCSSLWKALKLKGCHIISYIILPVSSCYLHVCPSSLFVCYLVLYSELVIKVHRSALRLDCRTMVSNQCTGWMILSYSTLQSDSIYTIWQHSLFRSTNRMSSTYAEHAKGSRQPGWNIFIFYFLHNGHRIKWLLNV